MQSSRCRIFLVSKPKLGPASISLHVAILDPRIAILRILQNSVFSNAGCKICKRSVLEFSDCHIADLPAHYCEILHTIMQTLHNMFVILRGGCAVLCTKAHPDQSRDKNPTPGIILGRRHVVHAAANDTVAKCPPKSTKTRRTI
jgi:hypothetical protein